MISKHNIKKVEITLLTTITLNGILFPAIASANQNNVNNSVQNTSSKPNNQQNNEKLNNEINQVFFNKKDINQNNSNNQTSGYQDITKDKEDLIKDGHFTSSELNQFSDNDIVNLHNHLYRLDYRVGTTKLAKAFLQAFKHLPKPIKRKILHYSTLGGFVRLLDVYTGTTHHIIYSVCRHVGMSKGTSSLVTKTVEIFI